MKLGDGVHFTHLELMPGVELYVYAVLGSRYRVLLDTGIQGMREQVLELVREVDGVQKVLITHAHADHIGCNRSVREATGAEFIAAGALPWIEDLETHYREFCRTDALPDSEEQRREILGLMDGPVAVEEVIGEGVTFRLGEERELLTLALPGHKAEEVGFLDTASGTLFVGDVLMALAAPFFHGFQSARGFRDSLDRIERLLRAGIVRRVLSSHHHPLHAEQALQAVERTRRHLEEIEEATLELAAGVDFATLWRAVSARLGKEPEFRGYAMLQVQVEELLAEGRMRQEGERLYPR